MVDSREGARREAGDLIQAGRADDAERVARVAGDDGVDRVEHAAGSHEGDFERAWAERGVAGGEFGAARGDVAIDGFYVGPGVDERDFVVRGGAWLDALEAGDGGDGVHDGGVARGLLGVAGAGVVGGVEGVGDEGGHLQFHWSTVAIVAAGASR